MDSISVHMFNVADWYDKENESEPIHVMMNNGNDSELTKDRLISCLDERI